MSTEPSTPPKETPTPWEDVTRFVRQLSHDLRNHLNAAELQAVYLNELTNDTELKEEIKRLRGMLSQLGTVLQGLSASLAEPRLNLMEYRACDLIEDIRRKFEGEHADRKSHVEWEIGSTADMLNVDPQLFQTAILELLENAFRHHRNQGPLRLRAAAKDREFALTLHEPKVEFASSTQHWGRNPLGNVTQGHYGLGLHRVRKIVEAHGGRYEANYEPASRELVSTIILPVSTARA